MPVAVKQSTEEQLKAIRAKRQAEQEARDRQKKGWHGLVYCEGEYASIGDFDGKGIWLGKANEIIPYLKKRGINGENIDTVLLAVDDFRSEQKNNPLKSPEMPLRGSKSRVNSTIKGISGESKSHRAVLGQKPPKNKRKSTSFSPQGRAGMKNKRGQGELPGFSLPGRSGN